MDEITAETAWLRLGEAGKLIVAHTGKTKTQAQAELRRAIQDGFGRRADGSWRGLRWRLHSRVAKGPWRANVVLDHGKSTILAPAMGGQPSWHDIDKTWPEVPVLIEVHREDLGRMWPSPETPAALASSGAPGRPSKSMHLILDELGRRVDGRKIAASLGDEAEALLTWLKNTHPSRERPTAKTIENNIRLAYRKAAADAHHEK